MKIKYLLFVVVFFAFAGRALAQSVTIEPREITYQRRKPVVDYKKSFTVEYPKVKGTSHVLARKIENSVSYERAFKFSLREEINQIQWLEEATYKVDYNKNGVLGIILSISGSGASPQSYNKPIVVNLRTGEQVRAQEVFVKLAELAAKCRAAQKAEIKKALITIKKEYPDEAPPAELFRSTRFTVKNLNEFLVNDRGITFKYDYGFPRVIAALQPDGDYFFKWSELKPFIKPGGLLARFVR
jgi:hypothetical protein